MTDFMRFSMGVTTGMVSMVLATAVSNITVKVSLVMMPLSSRTVTKIISIKALVCNSHPISNASPGCHFSILPASCRAMSLPETEANSMIPAAMNTASPPKVQLVRSPVLRKNTGMRASST